MMQDCKILFKGTQVFQNIEKKIENQVYFIAVRW